MPPVPGGGRGLNRGSDETACAACNGSRKLSVLLTAEPVNSGGGAMCAVDDTVSAPVAGKTGTELEVVGCGAEKATARGWPRLSSTRGLCIAYCCLAGGP